MSTLEKRVKKILADAMIAEAVIQLNRPRQEDLARWAVQKVLLMDLAIAQMGMRDYLGFVTHRHLAWLYEHHQDRSLPPGTRVWMFVHDIAQRSTPDGPRSRPFLHRDVRLVGTEDVGSVDPCAVLASFTVAFVGFQVFLVDFVDETPKHETPTTPPNLRSFLTRIGPVVYPRAQWPRTKSYIDGVEDFTSFAGWDGQPIPGFKRFKPPPETT
jgi:hypothetical protein